MIYELTTTISMIVVFGVFVMYQSRQHAEVVMSVAERLADRPDIEAVLETNKLLRKAFQQAADRAGSISSEYMRQIVDDHDFKISMQQARVRQHAVPMGPTPRADQPGNEDPDDMMVSFHNSNPDTSG